MSRDPFVELQIDQLHTLHYLVPVLAWIYAGGESVLHVVVLDCKDSRKAYND